MRMFALALLPGLVLAGLGARAIPAEGDGRGGVRDRAGLAGDNHGARGVLGDQRGEAGIYRLLTGTKSGETFTLVEKFEYDDGEKDQKTWVLQRCWARGSIPACARTWSGRRRAGRTGRRSGWPTMSRCPARAASKACRSTSRT